MISLGARLFVAALGLTVSAFAIWAYWFVARYGRLPGTDPSLEHNRPSQPQFAKLMFVVLFAGGFLLYMAIFRGN